MPIQTPGNPIDLHSIIEMFAAQNTTQENQIEQVDQAEAVLGTSAYAEQQALRDEGILTGQIESATDQLALARAKRNQESAALFGVNVEAHNSIIQEMAMSIREQHQEIKASAQDIQQRQSRSFMDDPMAWLVDAFALPQDVAAHNTRVQIMQQDIEVLEKLGDLADRQIARNNAIDVTTNAHLTSLKAERALAQALVRVENARQQALAHGIQFGSVRTAVSQQAFSNLMQVHGAQVQLQHLRLSQASQKLSESNRDLQRQQLQLLIDEKEEKAESKKELQLNLDRATAILGMRRITVNEYDRAPDNIKRALFDVMANPNIKEGRLGYDAVDAVETAHLLNAPLTPQVQEVKKILTNWTAEVSSRPDFAVLKPGEKHQKAQEHIVNKIKMEAGNIQDGVGLYSAPSITAVDRIPVVKQTALWKAVFEPQAAANNNRPLSAQSVYDAAASLVSEKKISLDQAAMEVALIYKAITMDNNQQRDYNRFALPMQNEYRTAIDTATGILRSKMIIDMSNPAEVNRQLLRTLSQQRALTQPNPLIAPNSMNNNSAPPVDLSGARLPDLSSLRPTPFGPDPSRRSDTRGLPTFRGGERQSGSFTPHPGGDSLNPANRE